MVEHTSDAQKYVYHYTRSTIAIDYILKSGTLRFGAYTSTNDPKETKSWEFSLLTFENRDLGKYKHVEMSQEFSAQLKSRANLCCFSTDSGLLTGDHMKDIYRRGFAKARMWAQYGDRHTGVCLVFDRQKLLGTVKRQFGRHYLMHGPVRYRDAALVRGIEHHEYAIDIDLYESLGPVAYLRSHVQRHNQSLFFEKLADWRDESEWRIVVLTKNQEDLFLKFEDSLVAVVHGDATDPDLSEEMMAITEGSNIQHLGLRWKNSSPWYDYGSFGWIPGKVTRPRRALARGA